MLKIPNKIIVKKNCGKFDALQVGWLRWDTLGELGGALGVPKSPPKSLAIFFGKFDALQVV